MQKDFWPMPYSRRSSHIPKRVLVSGGKHHSRKDNNGFGKFESRIDKTAVVID